MQVLLLGCVYLWGSVCRDSGLQPRLAAHAYFMKFHHYKIALLSFNREQVFTACAHLRNMNLCVELCAPCRAALLPPPFPHPSEDIWRPQNLIFFVGLRRLMEVLLSSFNTEPISPKILIQITKKLNSPFPSLSNRQSIRSEPCLKSSTAYDVCFYNERNQLRRLLH